MQIICLNNNNLLNMKNNFQTYQYLKKKNNNSFQIIKKYNKILIKKSTKIKMMKANKYKLTQNNKIKNNNLANLLRKKKIMNQKKTWILIIMKIWKKNKKTH